MAAAVHLGLQLHVLHAATEAEIEAAFASFAQLRAGVVYRKPKRGRSDDEVRRVSGVNL